MAPKPALPEIETPAAFDLLTRRDRWRGLLRLIAWGGAAAAAAAAVVLVSQTQIGAERLHLALTQTQPEQPQAVAALPPRAVVDEAATKRLAEAVRALTADRDRLNARLASLERNFNDMTGSIKTVLQASAAVQSVTEQPKELAKEAAKDQAKMPTTERPAALTPLPPTVSAPPVIEPSPPAAAIAPEPTPPAPPQASEQLPQENVPLPPVRVASAPAAEPSAEPPVLAKLEYGVDLGAAVSVEAIRGEWVKVKANYGPLLTGLRPLASPRQRDYRLLAGPFPTAAAAARLCAKFNAARVVCRTAKFTGEDVAQR